MKIADNEGIPTEPTPETQFSCPQCGSEAFFDTTAEASVNDESSITIPFACPQCGYKWPFHFQRTSLGFRSMAGKQDLIQVPAVKLAKLNTGPASAPSDLLPASSDQDIFTQSPLIVIPRPVFWGMLGLIVLLVGIGGWLFRELQQHDIQDQIMAEQQAALVLVRATGTAEQRMRATQQAADQSATATADARANVIASATASWAETSIATTATAEWKATGTAERVIAAQAEATRLAEQERTATAERIATANVMATTTAERIGTATAESKATVSAQETAAIQRQATSIAATSIALTPTPGPKLNLLIVGCDTGLDATHGLGEVKNAWVTVQNVGNSDASQVNITLSANDEGEPHPDKSFSIAYIPPQQQITLKLTVDTTLGAASSIEVVVTSQEGISASSTKLSCRNLDENAKKLIAEAGELGQLLPVKNLIFP